MATRPGLEQKGFKPCGHLGKENIEEKYRVNKRKRNMDNQNQLIIKAIIQYNDITNMIKHVSKMKNLIY